MSRKHLCALISLILAAILLSGCSMKLTVDEDTDEAAPAADTEQLNESTSTRAAAVSIIQYGDYTAMNECCSGVKKALDDAGLAYDVTVGSKSDCEQKARDLAVNSSCDLVVAIGTPCAEAVCPIIASAGRTPVIFCAVTDPVGAGIVENLNAPNVNCTGVATEFNISEQLNMINTFQPYITKLGVIYTESEQNTEQQLRTLKKAAEKLRITVYAEPVEDPSQLSGVAKQLMTKVEAVMLLPDHMTAMNSWNVTNQSIVGKVPLYGVTETEVNEGCLAGYCYDFEAIGEKAGAKAAAVLRGESAASSPVIVERTGTLFVNSDRLSDLDIEIPDEYKPIAHSVRTSYEKK